MNCRLPIYMLLALAVPGFIASCNSDDDNKDESGQEVVITTSLAVNSFSLEKNDEVLANLDSVFFTIDLDRALVYNADSLPKGTDVSKLVVNIGLPTVSEATLSYTDVAGEQHSIDYLTTKTDSIDFSGNSVKLHLVSYNQVDSRDYEIKINVHKMVPDSLYWDKAAMRKLPTTLSAPAEQRTVELGDEVLCFTRSEQGACVASASDPSGAWNYTQVTMPANMLIGSITATEDALYAVTSAGELLVSSDKGGTWNNTSSKMTHIYGGYENKVVGVRKSDDGKYYHCTYPATTESEVSADFPVAGTSQAVTYSNKWSSSPLMIVCGGAVAGGTLSGSTWGYDGAQWGCLSSTGLPEAEGICLVPYYTYKVSAQWVATLHSTLIAIGGKLTSGECQDKVYVSIDRGLHWRVADRCMQLPDYMEPSSYAQSVVRSARLTVTRSAGAGSDWKDMSVNGLPVWYRGSQTRAVTPITEWDCPYVYLFGGDTAHHGLNASVWRGVINRMTFKPLQ